MAGKHVDHSEAYFNATDGANEPLLLPPGIPGSRVDRAYAEGRSAAERGEAANTNPHNPYPGFGSPEFSAWSTGHGSKDGSWANTQFETATED